MQITRKVNGLKQETTNHRYLRSAAIEMILTSQCPFELFCLTNRMWFSVVCTLIDNEYASSHWSKCCGLTRRSRVSPQQMMLFSERDQDRDTKKEQALSITFSQSDWFIPKNERL